MSIMKIRDMGWAEAATTLSKATLNKSWYSTNELKTGCGGGNNDIFITLLYCIVSCPESPQTRSGQHTN